MAVRIKTKFRRSGPKSPEDRAGVVAVGIWKVAQDAFRRMGKEDFNFASEDQVTAFITEFVAFLVQAADRMVYGKIPESDRAAFINALGRHVARTFQESQVDFKGAGDHAAAFIKTLNARLGEYAEFDYGEKGPSYGMLRYLGDRVAAVMAMADNKWVLEYVMEIVAPEALRVVRKAVGEVMGIKVV